MTRYKFDAVDGKIVGTAEIEEVEKSLHDFVRENLEREILEGREVKKWIIYDHFIIIETEEEIREFRDFEVR